MEQNSDLRNIETLRKTLRQLNSNRECVYPSCTQKPCKSHVIAESVLKLLTDSGAVLTSERSEDDIIVNSIRERPWDQVYKEPEKVLALETKLLTVFFVQNMIIEFLYH